MSIIRFNCMRSNLRDTERHSTTKRIRGLGNRECPPSLQLPCLTEQYISFDYLCKGMNWVWNDWYPWHVEGNPSYFVCWESAPHPHRCWRRNAHDRYSHQPLFIEDESGTKRIIGMLRKNSQALHYQHAEQSKEGRLFEHLAIVSGGGSLLVWQSDPRTGVRDIVFITLHWSSSFLWFI